MCFAPVADMHDERYGNWNGLFEWWMDEYNFLTILISPVSRCIAVTSRADSQFASCWPEHELPVIGTWHHLVWRWNARKGRQALYQALYIDGLITMPEQKYLAPSDWQSPESQHFYVGCAHWPYQQSEMLIDELRVFSRDLSDEEVEALYQFADRPAWSFLPPEALLPGSEVLFCASLFDGQSRAPLECSEPTLSVEPPVGLIHPCSDVLEPGTQFVTLEVTTTEPAFCRCDTLDVPFEEMAYEMEGQGETEHWMEIPVSEDWRSRYFVRCAREPGEDAYPLVRTAIYRTLKDYSPT